MARKKGNKKSAKRSAPKAKRSAPKPQRSAPKAKRSEPKPQRSSPKAKRSAPKNKKKLSNIRSVSKNKKSSPKENKARRSDLRGRFKKDIFVDNAKAAGVKKIRSRKDLKKIRDFLSKKDKTKGGDKKKKVKKKKTLQTIKPISHKRKGKKWDPGGVEKQVKNNWDKIKDQYTGPKRLNVNFKSTGLLKKYGSEKGDGFQRNKFLADIKSSTLNRYKSKGGSKANLDQETTPNFDKIPDQYGRTLNAVRGSLSGIKKSPTADSVGSKLTKSYTPAPDKKATRKKRGLNILGIANNGITAS